MVNINQKTQQQTNPNSAARRARFYSRIKQALAVDNNHEAVIDNLAPLDRNYIYQPDIQNEQEREQTLIEYLTSQSAQIFQLANQDEIPKITTKILSEKSLGFEILIGENKLIQNLNWSETPSVILKKYDGNHKGVINYTMSKVLAAASETGTLFFASSAQNPAPLNFLPTCHIALLDAKTIFQTYEQVYEFGANQSDNHLSEASDETAAQTPAFPPRSLNMISGPSRTADIEQALTLGAHGPIELIVLIYNSKNQ